MATKIKYNDMKNILLTHREVFVLPPVVEYYSDREWDWGYEETHGYNGTRREFYRDFEFLMQSLRTLLNTIGEDKIYIIPTNAYCEYKYFERALEQTFDIISEIRDILSANEIKVGTRSSLLIDINTEFEVIEAFSEAAFRGHCGVSFFCPNNGISVEPWHHSNLLFRSSADEPFAKICRDLVDKQKFDHIRMFLPKSGDVYDLQLKKQCLNAKRCTYCYSLIDDYGYCDESGRVCVCDDCRRYFAQRNTYIE